MSDTGQGSAGNVISALASFFIPGLGQLIQGRVLRALFMASAIVLYATVVLWPIGAVVHLWSIVDAALYKRPAS